MSAEPIIEAVKNGWHALSTEPSLAVFGPTEDEALRLFKEAITKYEEIRGRPEIPDSD
jgi:predicted RNase H-like HicB family nuclease